MLVVARIGLALFSLLALSRAARVPGSACRQRRAIRIGDRWGIYRSLLPRADWLADGGSRRECLGGGVVLALGPLAAAPLALAWNRTR